MASGENGDHLHRRRQWALALPFVLAAFWGAVFILLEPINRGVAGNYVLAGAATASVGALLAWLASRAPLSGVLGAGFLGAVRGIVCMWFFFASALLADAIFRSWLGLLQERGADDDPLPWWWVALFLTAYSGAFGAPVGAAFSALGWALGRLRRHGRTTSAHA